MPERQPTTLSGLQVGDYVEGRGAEVWKVVRSADKPDGRYIGLAHPDRKPQIVKADDRPITRLVYPGPTMEQAIDNVQAAMPFSQVLAEHKPPRWFHPTHATLEADAGLLRAHLVRFHARSLVDPDMGPGDLIVIHRGEHADGQADHDHAEGDA